MAWTFSVVFERPDLLPPAIAAAVRVVLIAVVAAVILRVAQVVHVNTGAALGSAQESQHIARVRTPDSLISPMSIQYAHTILSANCSINNVAVE